MAEPHEEEVAPDLPTVPADLWARARDEAAARSERAATVRWAVWMGVIVVATAAFVATFAGLPVVAASSIAMAVAALAGLGLQVAVPRTLSRHAPALDALVDVLHRAFGMEAGRDDVVRLVEVGGTIVELGRVTATEEEDVVVLRHEVLTGEPPSFWESAPWGI